MRSDTPPPDRDDRDLDDEEDERRFPYFAVPYGGVPTWPGWGTSEASEPAPDEGVDYEDDAEGTWLDEGIITLVLIAGVVLFVIPEPATSGLGIGLVAFGLFLWLLDWLMPEP